MKTWERWSFHILTMVVAITGAAYFYMKHFMETEDPFAVINHPLQPWALNLHLLAAPALILVMGIIWNSHISHKLGNQKLPNRKTGWIALVTFPTMVFSGYLLPMISQETLSQGMLWLHLASGTVFAVSYAVHQAISLSLLRRNRRCKPEAVDRRLAA